MTTKAFLSAVLFSAVAMAAPAHAQVWNNGTPDNINGYLVSGAEIADNFTLANSTSLSAFNWWVLIRDSGADAITGSYNLNFYNNAGNQPGSLLSSTLVLGNGLRSDYYCCGILQSYAFSADLAGMTLDAGTYWLSVSNFVNSDLQPGYWNTSIHFGNDTYVRYDGDADFGRIGGENAFNLEGQDSEVTPEPASLVLLATGLLGVAAATRRKMVKKA